MKSWLDDSPQPVDSPEEIDLIEEDEFQVPDLEPSPMQELSATGGNAAPMNVSAKPRRKPQGSPIRKFIGIVVGGLAAIPLAIVILYIFTLFGKEIDLGFWPLNGNSSSNRPLAAPPVDLTGNPNGNRSLLSDEHRSLIAEDTGDSDGNPSAQAAALQQLGLGSEDPLADADPDNTISRDPLSPEDVDDGTGLSQAAVPDDAPAIRMPELDVSETPVPPLDDPANRESVAGQPEPSIPLPESGLAEDDSTEPAVTEPATKVRVKNSPELITHARQAARNLKTLAAMPQDDPARVETRSLTYLSIANVADAATSDSSVAQQMLTFLKDSPLLKELADETPNWLDYDNRPSAGILLVGQPGGGGQGPTLTLAADRVVPLTEDSIKLPAEQKVIAIGRIVDSPDGQAVELVASEPLP